jgi:hypothetical protein
MGTGHGLSLRLGVACGVHQRRAAVKLSGSLDPDEVAERAKLPWVNAVRARRVSPLVRSDLTGLMIDAVVPIGAGDGPMLLRPGARGA